MVVATARIRRHTTTILAIRARRPCKRVRLPGVLGRTVRITTIIIPIGIPLVVDDDTATIARRDMMMVQPPPLRPAEAGTLTGVVLEVDRVITVAAAVVAATEAAENTTPPAAVNPKTN